MDNSTLGMKKAKALEKNQQEGLEDGGWYANAPKMSP